MPKLTSTEGAKKWKDRLGGAVAEVVAGVNRVSESPMAKSAAAEDKWFQNIQRAHNSGKRKRALLGVSLEENGKVLLEAVSFRGFFAEKGIKHAGCIPI